MRVSISPRGSFIDMVSPPLPAGLDHARNLSERGQFTQHDPRKFQFAIIGLRAARQFAAVVQTNSRRVARQFGEFQVRLEALFHRDVLVCRGLLESGALGGIFLHQTLTLLLAFDHGFLCHVSFSVLRQLLKGMLNCFNSALASASVFAVVQMITSMPQTSSTLSKSISGNTICSLIPMA